MKGKNIRQMLKGLLLSSITLVVFITILLKGFVYFDGVNQVQSKELLEQSVRKATVECYAVEGVYPSTLEYLEENYGIIYDKDKYGVEYGCWSSNIMPTIVVYKK
ncbi:MAG: hypothetical protein Q4G58_00555 [bacterium]|nr:hypothetical protein [bacterium]